MVYSAILVILIYFFCKGSEDHENVQTVASAMFLVGGLLIARGKKIGWCMYIVADVLLVYVLLDSNDYIFVCFQTVSIYISVRKAFLKKSTSKKSDSKESLLYYWFIQNKFS